MKISIKPMLLAMVPLFFSVSKSNAQLGPTNLIKDVSTQTIQHSLEAAVFEKYGDIQVSLTTTQQAQIFGINLQLHLQKQLVFGKYTVPIQFVFTCNE